MERLLLTQEYMPGITPSQPVIYKQMKRCYRKRIVLAAQQATEIQ
jgi:hypothetical protein